MKKLFIILLTTLFTSCLKPSPHLKYEDGIVLDGQNAHVGENAVHAPPIDFRCMVIFKCEHDFVFSVNSLELHSALKKGDTVRIAYYDMVNGHGQVQAYKFMDAIKK